MKKLTLTIAIIIIFLSVQVKSQGLPYWHKWFLGIPYVVEAHNNLFAVGSYSGYIYVLDENGKFKWIHKIGTWIHDAAWNKNNMLAVGSLYVYVFDANGKLKWKYKTENPVFNVA